MVIHRRSIASPTTHRKKLTMDTDNAQNELVVNNMTRVLILSGIQHVIDEKRALISSDPRSKKYLGRDIDELNEIIEFIGNKEFSIVLN